MTQTDKPKQLRGPELMKRIEKVLKDHAKQAKSEGKPFILNKAAVARDVPCTRKTLLSYEDALNALYEQNIGHTPRKARDGSIELERVREKLKQTEERAKKLAEENSALVAMHTKLCDAIILSGVNPSVLSDITRGENVLSFARKTE